jgi:hypothetical protein
MNYYIKGEHPAKWVREKLRELGAKDPTYVYPKGIYCVCGDAFEVIFSEAVQATIEASPDWEEVKPTEPKFQPGDIVLCGGGFFQVTKVKEKDGEWFYSIGCNSTRPEQYLTRPDNPTVRHKVKEAFALLNNQHINFD